MTHLVGVEGGCWACSFRLFTRGSSPFSERDLWKKGDTVYSCMYVHLSGFGRPTLEVPGFGETDLSLFRVWGEEEDRLGSFVVAVVVVFGSLLLPMLSGLLHRPSFNPHWCRASRSG